jgi:hypothetical protein
VRRILRGPDAAASPAADVNDEMTPAPLPPRTRYPYLKLILSASFTSICLYTHPVRIGLSYSPSVHEWLAFSTVDVSAVGSSGSLSRPPHTVTHRVHRIGLSYSPSSTLSMWTFC